MRALIFFRKDLLPEKTVKIYGLRILGTNKYFYVGRTVGDVEHRIKKHLEQALGNKHYNKELENVIKTLMENNVLLTYDVLELCYPNDMDERESYWIEKLRKRGDKLFNIADPKTRRKKK